MIKTLCGTWFSALFIFFTSNTQAQTTDNYIAEHVTHAQALMREFKIPASVILAVAIHESAAGTSKVARYLNNHFGIKGSNSSTEIRSSYKDYGTVDESYDHFLDFLKNRNSFNTLFDKYDQYDYRSWARGIQRGGYARSSTWASQVIDIIKKNELFQYDERPDDYIEPAIPVTKVAHDAKHRTKRAYTIKAGDNLGKIAKKHHTTTKVLMQKNGLKNSALKPGQKIRL